MKIIRTWAKINLLFSLLPVLVVAAVVIWLAS